MDFHDRILPFRLGGLAGLGLGNSLFQHMAVHGEPDAGNVAVLFPAQQVAGAADFQIPHGNLKA